MNPLVVQNVARIGMGTARSAGILLRKSSFFRRDMYALVLGRRASRNIKTAVERNKRLLQPSIYRELSTGANSASSDAIVYVFGVVASVGIAGGIYYYSSGLQKTPIFKAALEIINASPMALKLLGSQIEKVGLARGSTKDGFSRITFVIHGANGEFLVTLTGTCSSDDKYEIDTLAMHKRSTYPLQDYYIYKDKVLQDGSESVEETNRELVE